MLHPDKIQDQDAEGIAGIFELLDTVWTGKWIVLASIILTTIFGFLLSQYPNTRTIIRFEYSINFPAMDRFPGAVIRPVRLNHNIEEIFQDSLRGTWNIKDTNFSSINSPAKNKEEFQKELQIAVQRINEFSLQEAEALLALVRRQLPRRQDRVEFLVRQELLANSLIDSISTERHDAVLINKIQFTETSDSMATILAATVFVGFCLGLLLIMLKQAYVQRSRLDAAEYPSSE